MSTQRRSGRRIDASTIKDSRGLEAAEHEATTGALANILIKLDRGGLDPLTPREDECMALLVSGLGVTAIATALHVTPGPSGLTLRVCIVISMYQAVPVLLSCSRYGHCRPAATPATARVCDPLCSAVSPAPPGMPAAPRLPTPGLR
jgi:hypothetical protein